jgi:hypothetical protein
MALSRRTRPILALGIGALLLIPGLALAAQETQLDIARCDPDEVDFTTEVTNPWFPLPAGRVWVLTGKEQGTNLGLRISVTGNEVPFYQGSNRVMTLEVEEFEWEDTNGDGFVDVGEPPIERSLNYFAQTTTGDGAGDVCYFGEAVDIFLEDGSISHEGAWRADDPGNAPGIIMPAEPAEGMTYQQESAPEVALDEATITRIGQTVTVPAGTYTNTLRTRDFNPLDGDRGVKVYANGVGIIRDGPLELRFP